MRASNLNVYPPPHQSPILNIWEMHIVYVRVFYQYVRLSVHHTFVSAEYQQLLNTWLSSSENVSRVYRVSKKR